jgi:3-oxoacyl-[acyl-carrier-protein] synthase-3
MERKENGAFIMKIMSCGKYLPKKKVPASEIDEKLGATPGWTLKATGVENRYFVEEETTSDMGAYAINDALKQSDLSLSDIDVIVSVGASAQQPIPCTAAMIAEKLGVKDSLVAFDINATCLGFLVGLDLMDAQLQMGRYKNVILVASEIASFALNWKQKESAALFGDGAAAVIITALDDRKSTIIGTSFETFPEGASYCQVTGGGTLLHPRHHSEETSARFLFDMNGPKVFKLAMRKMPPFLDKLLAKLNLTKEDVDFVIPYQASLSALTLLRKRLKFPEDKFYINVQKQGNLIAASLPVSLHSAIEEGLIKRGDKVLLLGSSAGVSLGAVIFEY